MDREVEAVGPTGVVDVGDAVGVLLLTRAQERLDRVTHARFTTFREGSRGGWDAASRRRLVDTLADGAPAVVDGSPVRERLAERRWLAWFPRPFGPHHAINVSGEAVGWTAARCPGIRVVRTHLAARSWQAEVLQAAGPFAATGWGGRRLRGWVARGERLEDDQVRWACVVEVTRDERDLVRAWAWGRGPVAAGSALATTAGATLDEPWEAGMPAPTLAAGDARRLLDALAGAGVLRWSVTGPDPR